MVGRAIPVIGDRSNTLAGLSPQSATLIASKAPNIPGTLGKTFSCKRQQPQGPRLDSERRNSRIDEIMFGFVEQRTSPRS